MRGWWVAGAAVVALGAATVAGGRWRWAREGDRASVALKRRVVAASADPSPGTPDSAAFTRALATLPAPVARYLALALPEGPGGAAGVTLTQTGRIHLGQGDAGWYPFTATHDAGIRTPALLWRAHVRMPAGVRVGVRDRYLDRRGAMLARLEGWLPLVDAPASTSLDEGALMRWLAEAPWYPEALLPGGAVSWRAVDDRHADATVRDGTLAVTLRFTFGDDGLVAEVRSGSRGREVDGRQVPTPWGGVFLRWAVMGSQRIPVEAEVSWFPPGEPPQPYWRGEVRSVTPWP